MQITRIHEDKLVSHDPVLQEYLDARAANDLAANRLKAATAALTQQMAEKHQKSFKWTSDGMTKAVTYVQTETPVIDEKGLRRALTAKVFDKFTMKKLDKKKMEAAMDTGEVDPLVVSKFVTMKPSTPYVRFTEKETEAGDLL